MLRSKSRSGFLEFGQKNHSSLFSRSFSGAKFCRRDSLVSQIDREALVSVDQRPSKVVTLSENRIDRVSRMQQQMGGIEEELKRTNEELDATKGERDRAMHELRETKQAANESKMRLSEAEEVCAELKTLKELVSNSKGELQMKEKSIESLKIELEKAKRFEMKLAEREASFSSLKDELSNAKASEAHMKGEMAIKEKKIVSLKFELQKAKQFELEFAVREASFASLKEELTMKEKNIEALKADLEKAKQFELKLVESEASLDILKEELCNVKASEAHVKGELTMKEKNMESLKVEFEKAKLFELKLAERESSLDSSKEEVGSTKVSEDHKIGKRIKELEDEIERGKISESKMFESVVSQTKQLEETKMELEESKLEIASLHEQIQKLQIPSKQYNTHDLNGPQSIKHVDSVIDGLKSELQLAKENLDRAQDGEKLALQKAKNILDEMCLLRNELKLATNAEEKSKKAMDDLALALTEVATEANQAKEKLIFTQVELDHVKEEAEKLKEMVRSTEDRYIKLLDKAKKETDIHKNTSDRLRLEAEESLLAWNGKEMGFVGCIKRAEEERSLAQHENNKLSESLKASREESYKLRDILKQAMNESNVAKEASSIAREENSHLKDILAEKDEALHFLTRENERLRINEAAAHESNKELKRLLSASPKELNVTDDNERENLFRSSSLVIKENTKVNKPVKTFSFDLNELKMMNGHGDVDVTVVDEDPIKAEALKGSIFDTPVSPKSEPHTPKPEVHHRRVSSAFTDDGEAPNIEDFDHLEGTQFDNLDGTHRRRRSALLKRFGDLIMRRSFHKKEASPTENSNKKEPSTTE